MAWRILMHAFKMIFSNWQDAIKLSFVPFALVVVLNFGMIYAVIKDPTSIGALGVLAVTLATTVLYAWIAVNWHRFVLLEEYPKAVPSFPTQMVFSYVWQSIKICAPLIVVVFGVFIMINLLGFMLPMVAQIGFSILLLFIASIFTLRLGITLPAASIGRKLTLKEALQKTDHLNGAIVGIMFLMLLIGVVAGIILSALALMPIIGTAIDLVTQWFMLLLGISLVTTLYGVAVEGRELRD